MKVIYAPKFLRSFEKLPSDIQEEFRIRERIFREDPLDPRLKTHKLKGKDEWAFFITYQIRVIFICDKGIAQLINIGDHSIYRE